MVRRYDGNGNSNGKQSIVCICITLNSIQMDKKDGKMAIGAIALFG